VYVKIVFKQSIIKRRIKAKNVNKCDLTNAFKERKRSMWKVNKKIDIEVCKKKIQCF
jgi:hypothetical protein